MIEIAQVLTFKEYPLATVFGQPGSVEFPGDYIWEVHQKFPGLVRVLAHTHPDGIHNMSEEDRTTLKAWTMALAPHPVVLDVISRKISGNGIHSLVHMRNYYILEPLSHWKERGKVTPRVFELVTHPVDKIEPWVEKMMELSIYLEP